VFIDDDQNSVQVLLPIPFEMGVTVSNGEADKYDKKRLRINPENDGKYLPLYRGYA
jgi:hypothetical protein